MLLPVCCPHMTMLAHYYCLPPSWVQLLPTTKVHQALAAAGRRDRVPSGHLRICRAEELWHADAADAHVWLPDQGSAPQALPGNWDEWEAYSAEAFAGGADAGFGDPSPDDLGFDDEPRGGPVLLDPKLDLDLEGGAQALEDPNPDPPAPRPRARKSAAGTASAGTARKGGRKAKAGAECQAGQTPE